MSYIETVLRQGTALWKQQEEQVQKRLRLLAYGRSVQDESADAAPGQDGESGAEEYLRRLSDAAGARSAPGSLPPDGGSSGETEMQGAQWMQVLLRAAGTQGVAGGERKQAVLFETPQDTAEAARFSESLERDARRYDGSFLLY